MTKEGPKIEYCFRPNNHWNFVSEGAYKVLLKFYDSTRLKTVEVKSERNK